MTSNFTSQIRQHIAQTYRALVRSCADNHQPHVDQAAAVLGMANRTADQLEGDIERLCMRRENARQLEEVAELEKDIEKQIQRYRAGIEKETAAKEKLDVATRGCVAAGSVEAEAKVNQFRCAVANARSEAKHAFSELTSLRAKAARLRQDSESRLRATAEKIQLYGDWTNPDSFALT